MSNEEQMAAIGRLITDASESKKRASLLKGEIEALSKRLYDASLHINGVFQGIHNADLPTVIHLIPTSELVMKTIEEFRLATERSTELQKRVAALGV